MQVVLEHRKEDPRHFFDVYGPFDTNEQCHDFIGRRRGEGKIFSVATVIQTEPTRITAMEVQRRHDERNKLIDELQDKAFEEMGNKLIDGALKILNNESADDLV